MLYVMLHLGDWSNWTRLYSLLERGILIELIAMYFSNESAINPSLFERITRRYTEEELKAFNFVIEDFFYLGDDGLYHNDACDQIIEKSKEKSEKARKSIQARWSKKTDEQRSKYERNTDEILTNNQEPITNNQLDVVTDTTCQSSEDPPEDGLFGEEKVQKVEPSGAPNCPTQKIVDLYHKTLPELPKVTLITSARQTATRSRWRDLYGAGDFVTVEQGIEVFKTYFEIVKSRDFLMGRCKPGGGREVPFRATYDWLMKQANFMKVCEGNYANSRRR